MDSVAAVNNGAPRVNYDLMEAGTHPYSRRNGPVNRRGFYSAIAIILIALSSGCIRTHPEPASLDSDVCERTLVLLRAVEHDAEFIAVPLDRVMIPL